MPTLRIDKFAGTALESAAFRHHYWHNPDCTLWSTFYARQHICYSAYMLSSVRPSVCHTGGSYKNGWS